MVDRDAPDSWPETIPRCYLLTIQDLASFSGCRSEDVHDRQRASRDRSSWWESQKILRRPKCVTVRVGVHTIGQITRRASSAVSPNAGVLQHVATGEAG
jgi:hypothetical protein